MLPLDLTPLLQPDAPVLLTGLAEGFGGAVLWYFICRLLCRKLDEKFYQKLRAYEDEAPLGLIAQLAAQRKCLRRASQGSPSDRLFFHSIGLFVFVGLSCVVYRLATSGF